MPNHLAGDPVTLAAWKRERRIWKPKAKKAAAPNKPAAAPPAEPQAASTATPGAA